jgi:NAD(P)H-dependent FMN reductase
MRAINLLAISGSVRPNSSNTSILRAMASLASAGVIFNFFDGLMTLPHFDPVATEGDAAVANFRQQLRSADGVVICTPEYAFGMPGVLKNALDWVVSSGEFNEKPVAAISASPLPSGGDKALASLLLTMTALGTITDSNMTLSIAGIKKKMNEDGGVTDSQTLQQLRSVLENLIGTIRQYDRQRETR